MHSNVKTVLGIFLFIFFGFIALWAPSEHFSHIIKTVNGSMPLLHYFKPELFAVVLTPLLVATGWRVWAGESHWSSVWFNAGVPLGVVASSHSLIAVLNSATSAEEAMNLVGESLLAIFYGGLVSLIGYLNLNADDIPIKRNSDSKLTKFFVLLLIYLIFGASMHFSYNGIHLYADYQPLAVNAALLSAFLLLNRDKSKSFCHLVCEAMVMASLASVMIAVISYNFYQGYEQVIGPIVAKGILGISYCSFIIFLCATFFSEKDLRETNFDRINWHLLEISGLWVLMCFAPKSLLEIFGG